MRSIYKNGNQGKYVREWNAYRQASGPKCSKISRARTRRRGVHSEGPAHQEKGLVSVAVVDPVHSEPLFRQDLACKDFSNNG